MKKTTILILLVALVLVASCKTDTETSAKPDSISSLDSSSTIAPKNSEELVVIPYIPISFAYDKKDEDYQKRWLEYIKEEFNLELQITTANSAYRDYNGNKIEELLQNNSVKGLAALCSAAQTMLPKLANSGEILALTDILTNNETWNNLPAEMQKMYEYNGDIWAIPSEYATSVYSRVIKNEWLWKLNLEVPETFDELQQLFRWLTKEDPDGDGIANTTGAWVRPLEVLDIFNNMDCFLQLVNNKMQVTSIAFDKNVGKFSDCMFDDRIKEPLEFIKAMVDEGIVEYNRPIGITAMTRAYFETIELSGNRISISGYNGKNNNPIIINYNGAFIVAAIEVAEPEKMINKFVDVFYGEPEAYLCAQYGLPGEAYFIGGNVKLITNDVLKSQMPVIVGYNPVMENGIEYISAEDNEPPYWTKSIFQNNAENLKIQDNAFVMYPETAFGIAERVSYETITHNDIGETIHGDELLGLFELYYGNIMNGFVTVDEGIAEYRKKAKELGVDEYINSLNENLKMD